MEIVAKLCSKRFVVVFILVDVGIFDGVVVICEYSVATHTLVDIFVKFLLVCRVASNGSVPVPNRF